MGKASRRASRRRRQHRSTVGVRAGASGLRLVVATSPVSAETGGAFLEHDLQMVRSALLYADTVELVSPVANMVGSVAALQDAGPYAWVDLVLQLDDDALAGFSKGQDPVEYRETLTLLRQMLSLPRAQRRKLLTPAQRGQVQQLRDSFEQMVAAADGLQDTVDKVLHESGAPELVEALESGALVVNWASVGFNEDMIERFSDHLRGLLASPDTHLLLDDSMADLARAMIDEGQVSPADLTLSRAARSRVGTGLVSNLPAFPDARVASILEARADLGEPLSAYRKGVTRISERLRSGPFDPPIESEVDDIWRDEVSPAVQRLRDDLSRTRLVRETVSSLRVDAQDWLLGGGLYFGVEQLTHLEGLAAAGVAAVPVVGKAVNDALVSSAGRRESARHHEFFYLLELDRKL